MCQGPSKEQKQSENGHVLQPHPASIQRYNEYGSSTRKQRNMELVSSKKWTRTCQGNHRNPLCRWLKNIGFSLLFSKVMLFLVTVQCEKAPILFEVPVKGGLSLRCASQFQNCIKRFHSEVIVSKQPMLLDIILGPTRLM